MAEQLPFVAHWRNALRESDLPTTAKAIGFVLSTYMNRSGYAYPAKLTLARGASLSTKTKDSTAVHGAIALIEAAGLLVVTRNRGRKGWEYQAVIPRADEGLAVSERDSNRGESGSESHADHPVIPRPAGTESHAPAWAKAVESEIQESDEPQYVAREAIPEIEEIQATIENLREAVTYDTPLKAPNRIGVIPYTVLARHGNEIIDHLEAHLRSTAFTSVEAAT